jgi:ribosomal protein L37AE/L43A
MQFGFRENQTKSTAKEVVGNCPFCQKEDHFSFDRQSGAWHCKRCGRGGGYQKFVDEVVRVSQENFGKYADNLSSDRGIKSDTLKKIGRFGYFPSASKYVLPVYGEDAKSIVSLKTYDGQMMVAAGQKVEMYGLWWLSECHEADTIYICEGEWDTLVMREALQEVGRWGKETVIGVPSATSFKTSILPYFLGKKAILLYDNDEAGNRGCDKAAGLLVGAAHDIFSIVWPSDKEKGYDIRDLYRDHKRSPHLLLDKIAKLIKPKRAIKQAVGAAMMINTNAAVSSGEHVPVEQVYDVFKKWLHLPPASLSVVDVVFGTVFASKFQGEPLWMFIVAPPGGTKTEPIMALSGGPGIVTLSSLTPATLVSGMNLGGADPSLLPQLDGRVLVIKDFTNVLTLNPLAREEIFGTLRDAYDGEYAKVFGNGVVRRYRSRFGMIAAVTPVIEHYIDDHVTLGERFLRWENNIDDDIRYRREFIKRANANSGVEDKMRKELGELARKVISKKIDPKNQPTIPTSQMTVIEDLAQIVAILRGAVRRDRYSKEITHKPFLELGTRLSKQFLKVAIGIASFHGNEIVTEHELEIIRHVAKSTIPARTVQVFSTLMGDRHGLSATDVAKVIGLPAATCMTVLENLIQLGAVERNIESDKIFFRIKSDIDKTLKSGGLKWALR